MKVTWLLQGSILFESNGYRLLIDPYISDFVERKQGVTRMAPPPLKADRLKPSYIYCTHNHMDHVDPEGLPEIVKLNSGVRIGGPSSVQRKCVEIGLPGEIVDVMSIGTEYVKGPFKLTPVKAFHSDPESTGLRLEGDGLLIYISGDTLADPDLAEMVLKASGGRTSDFAFTCINGRLGNMNADEAVEVARKLKAKCVVPMHYGLFAENTVEPEPFLKSCAQNGIDAFKLIPGKTIEIKGA